MSILNCCWKYVAKTIGIPWVLTVNKNRECAPSSAQILGVADQPEMRQSHMVPAVEQSTNDTLAQQKQHISWTVISGALNQATAAAASLPKFGRLPYRCSLVIAQDPTKLYSCRMGLAFFQGRVSVVTFPNAPASITFGEVAAVASLGNCLNLRAPIHKHRPYFWLVVSTGDSIQFWNG